TTSSPGRCRRASSGRRGKQFRSAHGQGVPPWRRIASAARAAARGQPPMTVVILKFLHAATISLWSAGLLALPFIYRQRRGLEGDHLYRLHIFTRYFYVGFVSPSAFVAIGTGTALIFLRETYVAWFSWKLLLVTVMTGIHLFSGLLI